MTDLRPRTRLTREQSRHRTRDLLVSAATRVFAREGYAGASVDAIAGQAGFTVGALYSNFATKQELFLAVFERHCAGELAALRALADTATSAQELLAAITARFATMGQEEREWWQLSTELWLYAQRHPDAARRLAAVHAEARQVIAGALGHGGEPLTGEVAALVHALWAGFMHYRLISPDALSPDAFGRAVGWLLAGHEHDEKKGTQP
jgi:AcrR family transcriptional regulator